MGALGKQFDPLRLVGGVIDPPAHFHWNHRILLAVQDENRGRHGADVALVVVFVGNQQAEWQPEIGPPRHIDRRGERRFQHDRGHRPFRRQPHRLARAQGLTVGDDSACRHPEPGQVIVGRDRVGDIVLFRGLSAGAAIATVVEVEDAETVRAARRFRGF